MPHTLTMTRDLFASKAVRWGIVLTLAILIAAYVFTDARKYLTIESVRDVQSWFMGEFDRSPIVVTCCFFALFTVIAAISMPGAAVLMLVAGSSYGLLWGTLISTLASVTGATIAMLATRFLFRDWVEARYAAQMREVDRGIDRNGVYYVFSLRVAPVIPYFVLNWLIGLTTMRVWPFFWVSFIGMLPGTAVYVNAGRELSKVTSFSDVFSWPIALSLVALAVAPFLLKFIIEKFNARSTQSANEK
jgi:uncharacterized membrane protein YdjX (TVP38/TMEM64 family)